MAKRDLKNKTRYVIVGGGPAGLNCAETLRQSDFTGEIVVISDEQVYPYDRTNLSKAVASADASKFTLRSADFLSEHGIDYKLKSRVKHLDNKRKFVTLTDGSEISYDKICIATGARPVKPTIPGADLNGVFTVRTDDDQTMIKQRAKFAKTCVIIGSSFIGTEAAASLKSTYKSSLDVYLVSSEGYPLQRVLGEDFGKVTANIQLKEGVRLTPYQKVKSIKDDGQGNAKAVVFEDGSEIPTDMVIMGTGVKPNTDFLRASDIQLSADGGIACDPFLQSSDPSVFAAGDIAEYPFWISGERIRSEHWNSATDQGSYAAFNMLGKMQPYANVPFFWTRFFNKKVQVIGHAHKYDKVDIQGDIFSEKFIVFYSLHDRVLQVAGMNKTSDILTYMEAMNQNKMPTATQIRNGEETPQTVFKKLKQAKGKGGCRRQKCCHKKKVAS